MVDLLEDSRLETQGATLLLTPEEIAATSPETAAAMVDAVLQAVLDNPGWARMPEGMKVKAITTAPVGGDWVSIVPDRTIHGFTSLARQLGWEDHGVVRCSLCQQPLVSLNSCSPDDEGLVAQVDACGGSKTNTTTTPPTPHQPHHSLTILL